MLNRRYKVLGWIVFFAGAAFCAWFFLSENFFGESRVVFENKSGEEIVSDNLEVNTQLKPQIDEDNSAIEDKKNDLMPDEEKKTMAVVKERGDIPQDNKKKDSDLRIINSSVDFGQEKRASRNIDTIIIHSSYDALGDNPYDAKGIIQEYRIYGVAAHYLIDREGLVYQLVEDKNVAYHAGASSVPDGRTGVNEFSLGIEMVNNKTDKYTDAQYGNLNRLVASLKKKYKIRYVLGHNQIAPGRKDDPWNFEWNRLK